MEIIYLGFILILSFFLGFELIRKVPSRLHTPLMSGANAISGITLVGVLISLKQTNDLLSVLLVVSAIIFATINVVGGYIVTDRMLSMLKDKKK